MLLQDYKLLAFSIRENIVLNKDEEEENILACIEKSGLGDKVRSLKQGLETVLYKDFSPNGIELSGGENQKLVLAREIYKNGLFFILDEPTASLDPIAEYDFYEGLRNLAGSQTCLYISHRLYSVKAADFIIVMNEGKVCEIGTHDYLMKIKGLYYDMFSKQASLYIVGGCNE